MSKKNTPDEETAAMVAQGQRIERSALDFGEDFLAGNASIEIRPLDGATVGEISAPGSLLNGFTIRLLPVTRHRAE